MTAVLPRDLLARCAGNFPAKVAYYCGEAQRTWLDMDRRADLLGGALQVLGARKGDAVAILGRESFQIYEHFFACMKIGAVRVGLNWRYAPVQILHILRDCRARFLLVEAALAPALQGIARDIEALGIGLIGYGRAHGLPLDYETLLDAAKGGRAALPPLSTDEPCFYSYTSGTTGQPKGVILTQGGVVHTLFQSLIARGLRPDDIWCMVGQSSWMTVLMQIFGLGNGMSHVIPDGAFEIGRFLRDVERRRVTAVSLVPTNIQRALKEIGARSYDLTSLRVLGYGSAPASPSLIRAAREAFGCGLLQAYGLTEAGGWVTHLTEHDHEHALEREPALLGSSGRAGVLYQLSIRDDRGEELPQGEPGEVWIRGPSVMKGYLNLDSLTGETLRDGWLRSHDIGRLDERGYLFLLDRRNFMIISGGVNVFPAAIEAVLIEHPAVEEVAVVGAPHPEWGEVPVAIVRPRGTAAAPAAEELIAFCSARLSKPECPRHVLLWDELPKLVTGKVNKQLIKERVRGPAARLPWTRITEEEEA